MFHRLKYLTYDGPTDWMHKVTKDDIKRDWIPFFEKLVNDIERLEREIDYKEDAQP